VATSKQHLVVSRRQKCHFLRKWHLCRKRKRNISRRRKQPPLLSFSLSDDISIKKENDKKEKTTRKRKQHFVFCLAFSLSTLLLSLTLYLCPFFPPGCMCKRRCWTETFRFTREGDTESAQEKGRQASAKFREGQRVSIRWPQYREAKNRMVEKEEENREGINTEKENLFREWKMLLVHFQYNI